MTTFPIIPWLVAWSLGIGAFLGPILLLAVTSQIRRLNRKGIHRPLFVIVRRAMGMLPIRSWRRTDCSGRTVFVAWDVRWMDSGETNGRVVTCDPESGQLEIELDQPATLADADGNGARLTRAIFVPDAPDRAAYGFAAGSGLLLRRPGDPTSTTAVIVVYPEQDNR